MDFIESKHWENKKLYRKDIREEHLEYALLHSSIYRDRQWDDAYNALARIPPMRRMLKVVYKRKEGKIIVITAYWLD